MLIDSNIIIYAAQSDHHSLRQLIADHSPFVSAVSYVEVLGYHRLTQQERQAYEAFFAAAPILPISENVLEEAMRLRQRRKMTLGDALIAGPAIVHKLILVTRNTKDLAWIAGLSVSNPFESS
jgi:toxin FitB